VRRLILFGVGSRLVVDYEETCTRAGIQIAAAIKNRPVAHYLTHCQRVISPNAIDADLLAVPFLCPLFTPAYRWRASLEALAAGLFASEALIDPSATVASSVEFGPGCYINAAATIGGCGKIGAHVVINRSASIGHHLSLAEYASVGPGVVLTGEVSIGKGALVGAGSVVLPKIRIGDHALIAAGSVVTRDVEECTLVAGNPARLVRKGLEKFE
jgi:hypothetical protein